MAVHHEKNTVQAIAKRFLRERCGFSRMPLNPD